VAASEILRFARDDKLGKPADKLGGSCWPYNSQTNPVFDVEAWVGSDLNPAIWETIAATGWLSLCCGLGLI